MNPLDEILARAAQREKELEEMHAAYEQMDQAEYDQFNAEMDALETEEAKLYKALDGLEALIQHNEAPLSSWVENEYDLQMTYADDRVGFSAFLTALREQVRADSLRKIQKEKDPDCPKDF